MRRPAAKPLAVLFSGCLVVIGCLPGGSRGTSLPSLGGAGDPMPTPSQAAPSGPTPIPSFVAPTPTPAPTFLVYTVMKGDSLNTIARKFGTTARSIAYWNRATYPSLDPESPAYRPGLLQVGWTLSLLPSLVVDEDSGEAVYPSEAPSEP